MKKSRIIAYTGLLILTVYIALGFYVRAGKVLAVSRNEQLAGKPTIKVREIHDYGFWMFPLQALAEDDPPYRFEYYAYHDRQMRSSETFQGKSYVANNAQIEWASDGTATVSLEHVPYFTCKDGNWKSVR